MRIDYQVYAQRIVWLLFMLALFGGGFKLGYIVGEEDREAARAGLEHCIDILQATLPPANKLPKLPAIDSL